MKLAPIIKLIGKFIVSLNNRLTFRLVELFWIPIIKSKNKERLKVKSKNNFLSGNFIFL